MTALPHLPRLRDCEADGYPAPDGPMRWPGAGTQPPRRGRVCGQRLDAVLIQLGLVSERGLAEAYATLLDLPVARADQLPGRPAAVRRPA